MDSNISTATIRQRGQLTIPDEIRNQVSWLETGSAVTIETNKNEIKIKPYQLQKEKKLNWKSLWQQISLVRTFKGKKGNLSRFIEIDRGRH